MKTIPPVCPEPETGRQYWRSLDQLADKPEFRTWMEREFPEGASEWTDPVSRRHFVRIMSASFLLAGMGLAGSGCRRPEQKILPFGKMPENYVHGVAQFYATAMPTRGSAIPLVVKSNEGRPTKVEGNSMHPDSNGSTERFAQASILDLYDPDRAMRILERGNVSTEAKAFDALAQVAKKAADNEGQGLSFLMERSSSPSRRRLQKLIREKYPHAKWYIHEPVGLDISARAATQACGQSVKPYWQFDKANVIVSLDCDFIGSEEDAQIHIRRFAQHRALEKEGDFPSRLYAVESLMTLTGMNADHRLRIPSTAVASIAQALVSQIMKQGTMPSGVDAAWINQCAADLMSHRGESLVVAGHRQPMEVHLLVHALNEALSNVGETVVFQEAPEAAEGNLADLAKELNAGHVSTLVILGSNPAYTTSADLDWAAAQQRATVIRLAHYEDETTVGCAWHLPAAHYLESWGDAQTADGTLVPIQPLIAPMFGGLTEIEVLARIAGATVTSPYEIVRETFAGMSGGADEFKWNKFLHDGFLPDSAAKPVAAKFNPAVVPQALTALKKAPALGKDNLEVVFHRDYSMDDGRYANNGWLQEMPDPVTKMTWDNAVLISRKTAADLGVENSDVVEVKLGNRTVRGPIWVQPGHADYSLGLALGYGRQGSGRIGNKVGFNAYLLRTSDNENFTPGATIHKTSETYMLACTQDHWSMEGRPIIREANLAEYRKNPHFVNEMKMEEPRGGAKIRAEALHPGATEEEEAPKPLYPNPLDELKKSGLHQWGMSIDLNRCVGCQACMLACQSENNVPIVGKEQIKRGREMHWLRIDRYYAGPPKKHKKFDTYINEEKQQFQEWIDDPQVVTQPMLCQHCESAPCENVCPVNATVHDQEGLNLMVYNRCVGTRYCSNNCPYKVRRFNYFDYNKRGIGHNLYWGPLKHRRDDEWDLLKMIKNPDVTVRMRGVMEKCTFCIQRIEGAKIAQKVKAGGSADVIVPRDSFTTACAQACPAGAIVFGNIADSESRVSKLKKQDRDYAVLEYLLTKPRLTYLAKVRNPNPNMPDPDKLNTQPFTVQEFVSKSGEHEEGHEAAGAVRGAGKGEH